MSRSFKQFISFLVASFKSQLRNPSGWAFGFIFPLIFIVLFGFITTNNNQKINLGIVKNDSENYKVLKNSISSANIFELLEDENYQNLENKLQDGDLDGIIRFTSDKEVLLISNSNKPQNTAIITQTINQINNELTLKQNKIEEKTFKINLDQLNSREVRYIDFVLPGILGYSLLSSAIFGVGFSFLVFKKQQILKRLFVAPTRVWSFLLGQALARFVYIFLQVIMQIILASILFKFSPRNGLSGTVQMFVIMAIGLVVFLGFGYIVAGISKSDDTVAPIANLIVFPQFILAGTFFSTNNLPTWLSTIAKFMPLYNFNEAMRLISINGQNLWDVKVFTQISFLALWGIFAYIVAGKVFKVK
jgi:ABC-2 type transport system permease protein